MRWRPGFVGDRPGRGAAAAPPPVFASPHLPKTGAPVQETPQGRGVIQDPAQERDPHGPQGPHHRHHRRRQRYRPGHGHPLRRRGPGADRLRRPGRGRRQGDDRRGRGCGVQDRRFGRIRHPAADRQRQGWSPPPSAGVRPMRCWGSTPASDSGGRAAPGRGQATARRVGRHRTRLNQRAASALPCAAAKANQRLASALSAGMPHPCRCITPMLVSADELPCAAAFWSQIKA